MNVLIRSVVDRGTKCQGKEASIITLLGSN